MPITIGFVTSTPEPARETITCLRKSPQTTAKEQALLDRLASDLIMNDVWTRLQGNEDQSGDVICHVLDTARLAMLRRPPFPKRNMVAQQKWLLKHPPSSTLEGVAVSALWLRESMIETQQLVQSIYPELRLDELLAEVNYIERIYKEAHDRHAQYWKSASCLKTF